MSDERKSIAILRDTFEAKTSLHGEIVLVRIAAIIYMEKLYLEHLFSRCFICLSPMNLGALKIIRDRF